MKHWVRIGLLLVVCYGFAIAFSMSKADQPVLTITINPTTDEYDLSGNISKDDQCLVLQKALELHCEKMIGEIR